MLRALHVLAVLSLVSSACTRNEGAASVSFSGGPGAGAGEPASDGSSDAGTSSSSAGSQGSDASTGAALDTTGSLDAGTQPDFPKAPAGCGGKIDFLFLVGRDDLMLQRQAQLATAFPHFIETIQAKFADFDYHIMVVDGDGPWPDGWWGDLVCNDVCPDLDCKVGQSCCKYSGEKDEPCCREPDYPCEAVDAVTQCDVAWGAGVVFPAGEGAANEPCAIDDGRRYIVKGQTNRDQTFACMAAVGGSGYGMLGQALTAAVQRPINDFGGCNQGFLRDDALLMVTFVSVTGDSGGGAIGVNSEGTPEEWAQAVVDAKHGDERSVVMLNIGYTNCIEEDGLCRLTEMFTFHRLESHDVDDYGPAFAGAADLVAVACEDFVPPPG